MKGGGLGKTDFLGAGFSVGISDYAPRRPVARLDMDGAWEGGGEGQALMAGVQAFVLRWRADGDLSFHAPLVAKLEQLGAKTASRLGKEVTHVVFTRTLSPNTSERAQEEQRIRELYDKASKVAEPCCTAVGLSPIAELSPRGRVLTACGACMRCGLTARTTLLLTRLPPRPSLTQFSPPPFIVSPLWVHTSVSDGLLADVSHAFASGQGGGALPRRAALGLLPWNSTGQRATWWQLAELPCVLSSISCGPAGARLRGGQARGPRVPVRSR